MSTRRARIKVAPNLGAARSKGGAVVTNGLRPKVANIPKPNNVAMVTNGLRPKVANQPQPNSVTCTDHVIKIVPEELDKNENIPEKLVNENLKPTELNNKISTSPRSSRRRAPLEPRPDSPDSEVEVSLDKPSAIMVAEEIAKLSEPAPKPSGVPKEDSVIFPDPKPSDIPIKPSIIVPALEPSEIHKETSICQKETRSSTGQFVNGKYLASSAVENSTPANTSAPEPDSTSVDKNKPKPGTPAKSTMRRFLGMKNKFKPNLLPRSQQFEQSIQRERKISSGDKTSQRERKNSVGDLNDVGRTRKNSSGDSRSRKSSASDSGNESFVRTRKLSVGDQDGPASRTRKLSAGDPNAFVETGETRSKALSGGAEVEPATAGLINGGRKRLRSGSNSSGDESRCRIKLPPSVQRDGVLEGGSVTTPLLNDSPPNKPRIRRLTDTTKFVVEKTNPVLKRRKRESKRRFSKGVPDRETMTMFDLIYYNPDNGTAIVSEEPEPVVQHLTQPEQVEEKTDDPVPPSPPAEAAEDEDSNLPVPQVKVGINGEIIIDESSTLLETTASKRAKEDLTNSPVVVENANRLTNYGTWSKKRRYSDWGERETFKFYRALSIVGSDFSMMETLFKKRTRHELKLKFKKEEKANGVLVDKCLAQRGQFKDMKDFVDEDSEDDEKVDKPTRGRKRKGKAATQRKKFTSRGMYESSSGGEDADVSESSRSPARKRQKPKKPTQPSPSEPRRNARISVTPAATTPAATAENVSIGQLSGATARISGLEKMPGVHFPPALLAANPGLAGAKPGSLVVVASPSKTDPTSQLLHVYMVSEKNKKSVAPRTGSPVTPRSRNTEPGRLSIDPAVVRAVDRKRSSADRSRTPSGHKGEAETSSPNSSVTLRRQRTLSEGNVISPSRLKTYSDSRKINGFSHEEPYTRTRISGSEFTSTSTFISGENASTSGQSPASGDKQSGENEISSGEESSNLPIARKSKPS